jgi:LPS sulfotransferase NodH
MYSQAREFPQVVRWAKKEDINIIHLIRSNVLKMLVSREVAKLRDIYHSTKKVEPIKISLKTFRLKARLKNISRQVDVYRSMFKDIPYLEITYENFVANRDEETRRLLGFLEIDMRVPLISDLVKLNPETLADVIENYDQVAQTLEGTAFERFL